MARIGRRAQQRRNLQIVLTVLLILVTGAVLGGIAYFMGSRLPGLDDRMCPASGPVGHVVLLVDTTDPFSFTQKQAYSAMVKEIIEKKTPQGFLFSVFVLGEDFKTGSSPLVELCNPGTGADKNEFTANLRKLRRQYEEGFSRPLIAQAEGLVGTQPSKSSPVLEMLQLVAINGFRRNDIKGERRLIIVSDMLHNTPQFSMYRELPDYGAFATSAYGQKTQLHLEDIEIELHYLINAAKHQTRQNLNFWEQHFNKAGARVVVVRPMEG